MSQHQQCQTHPTVQLFSALSCFITIKLIALHFSICQNSLTRRDTDDVTMRCFLLYLAAARAKAAKEEAEREEVLKAEQAKAKAAAKPTTTGQDLPTDSTSTANLREDNISRSLGTKTHTTQSASYHKGRTEANLSSVSRRSSGRRQSVTTQSLSRTAAVSKSLDETPKADMPKGKGKSGAGGTAGKPGSGGPGKPGQKQSTHPNQARPKSPTYSRKAATKPTAERPHERPAGQTAEKAHIHQTPKHTSHHRISAAQAHSQPVARPYQQPAGVKGKPKGDNTKLIVEPPLENTMGVLIGASEIGELEDEDDEDDEDGAANINTLVCKCMHNCIFL